MIPLHFLPQVDEGKCTGCTLCERVCPAGAIKMEAKLAVIDTDRCIDCQRCIDRCNKENAIRRVPRPHEVIRYVDHTGVDPLELKALCQKAGILPELPVCGCTRTTGRETIAAILKGAKTPEDLCAMTGLRAGCGIYCITRIFQIFEACGVKLQEPKDRCWINLTLALGDIPEDTVARIDKTFPQYHLGEDWNRVAKRRTISVAKEGSHA